MYKYGKAVHIAVIAVIIAAILFFPARLIYFHNYPHDRITGRLSVSADGRQLSPDEYSITFAEGGFADGGDISMPGGGYEHRYSFDVNIPSLDKPVTVYCFELKEWDVIGFELDIDIDTKENTVKYSGSNSFLTSLGFSTTDSFSKTQPLSDEKYEVGFGL